MTPQEHIQINLIVDEPDRVIASREPGSDSVGVGLFAQWNLLGRLAIDFDLSDIAPLLVLKFRIQIGSFKLQDDGAT